MSDFKERNEHFARAMTDAQVSYIEAERAACDLEAENAKLRDLLADVHEALCLDKAGVFHEAIIKSLERDMRELGIEVGE